MSMANKQPMWCGSCSVQADASIAAQYEPLISEAVFKTWTNYANDPLISIDAYDVLGALAAIPECQ
eukprot:scaffold380716_cov23-Prasinocladus_malaysianus.AAC.1